MAALLDNPRTRTAIDPDGMLDWVERFGQQCRDAERIARAYPLPKIRKIEHVVVTGMGGSAIGGDLTRAYAASQSKVPFEVVRNYTLPNYVGLKTLVIAVSYSGDTEETLSAFNDAKKRGAVIAAISTGDKLTRRCKANAFPCVLIPGGCSPRAALGYSMIPLLVMLEHWGILPDQRHALSDMVKTIERTITANAFDVPTDSNPAKQVAMQLHGTLPVIYAGQDAFQPVAARWRAQINENAKTFAHDFVVPEMNHNEILGWNQPSGLVKKMTPVFLLDKGYHKQTLKRFEVMKKILPSEPIELESSGTALLARLFSLIGLGDFVSVYLAYLYKQDPVPIPAIDRFKRELG